MPQTIRSIARDRALRVIRAHRAIDRTRSDCSCGFVGDHDQHLATLLADALVTDWDAIRAEVAR